MKLDLSALRCSQVFLAWLLVSTLGAAAADDPAPPAGAAVATVRIDAGKPAARPIPKYITGKFCEHLGSNIYHGMDAQILRNPTLADYPFKTGAMTPDGIAAFAVEPGEIAERLRGEARRFGWPEEDVDALADDWRDALACGWIRQGQREDVRTSPESGPAGGRAQRVQTAAAGQGIAQWVYLPLERVRSYQFEILARSPDLDALRVALYRQGEQEPCAEARSGGLATEWETLRGTLEIGADEPADALYRLAVTTEGPGQVVVGRVWLRPADHLGGADPDVVRMLRESRLPILRWPGGNFVSGYHWANGVGPIDRRPTLPNYAWGRVETNAFGTDEFVAFCRVVGCEPMICINAGDGTPEEAARWVEYCNGPADSPMGKLRAANGHPEPYHIRHWEVGNELWGRWQFYWTTAEGYVDRYRRFRTAMLAADPTIRLYACGAPVFWGKDWNDTLIRGAAAEIQATTDHPLIGGTVSPSTDPLDVYRDFMVVPDVLARKWKELEAEMKSAGIDQPRLAVTELQMFAHLGSDGDGPRRLTRDNLVNPATLAEALYDVLIYHRAIRLAPFVEMVTHSATVNHGGGLRKQRERVFANPCHLAQGVFAEFAGATPLAAAVESGREQVPLVLPSLRGVASKAAGEDHLAVLDALAARAPDGSLLVSLVHRGTQGPVRVEVEIDGFPAAPEARQRRLSAEVPWARNSLEAPQAIAVEESKVAVRDRHLSLTLPPFSWTCLRIPPKP